MNSTPSTDVFLKAPLFEHPAAADIPGATGGSHELEVFVIFTDNSETLAALRMACRLAEKLDAHLRLLMFYEVPYALPLTRPGVSVAMIEEQIQTLASRMPVDVSAHIYLCRDKYQTARLILKPNSIVILGDRRRWWRFTEQKMASRLKKYGHQVFFAELR